MGTWSLRETLVDPFQTVQTLQKPFNTLETTCFDVKDPWFRFWVADRPKPDR